MQFIETSNRDLRKLNESQTIEASELRQSFTSKIQAKYRKRNWPKLDSSILSLINLFEFNPGSSAERENSAFQPNR